VQGVPPSELVQGVPPSELGQGVPPLELRLWWEYYYDSVQLVWRQDAERLKRSFLVLVFEFVKKETMEIELFYW
jgi:hypothetical protein